MLVYAYLFLFKSVIADNMSEKQFFKSFDEALIDYICVWTRCGREERESDV